MTEEKVLAPSFLDVLPIEFFDNVLRSLSRIPYSNKWENHVDLRDMLELFAISGKWGAR